MVKWKIQRNVTDGSGTRWEQQYFSNRLALIEGETAEGWSFFVRNLRLHVAPQPNLCLIFDRHPSIISVYNDIDNGWKNPPSTHVFCIRHIA